MFEHRRDRAQVILHCNRHKRLHGNETWHAHCDERLHLAAGGSDMTPSAARGELPAFFPAEELTPASMRGRLRANRGHVEILPQGRREKTPVPFPHRDGKNQVILKAPVKTGIKQEVRH